MSNRQAKRLMRRYSDTLYGMDAVWFIGHQLKVSMFRLRCLITDRTAGRC